MNLSEYADWIAPHTTMDRDSIVAAVKHLNANSAAKSLAESAPLTAGDFNGLFFALSPKQRQTLVDGLPDSMGHGTVSEANVGVAIPVLMVVALVAFLLATKEKVYADAGPELRKFIEQLVGKPLLPHKDK